MEKLRPAAGQEQRTGSVMAFPVSAVHFPVLIPAALPAARCVLSGERHTGVFCAGAFIFRRSFPRRFPLRAAYCSGSGIRAFSARERSSPGGACGGAGEEGDYLKTQLISGGNF